MVKTENPISGKVNRIGNENVLEDVRRWIRYIVVNSRLDYPFSRFFVAGKQEEINAVFNELLKQFSHASYGEIKLSPSTNIVSIIPDIEKQLDSLSTDMSILRVEGFEGAFKEIDPNYSYRTAHDMFQAISIGTQIYDRVNELKKHIVIVVTIPAEASNYEDIISSATTCDFKDGIIEVQ